MKWHKNKRKVEENKLIRSVIFLKGKEIYKRAITLYLYISKAS